MRSGCPPDVVWRRGFPKGDIQVARFLGSQVRFRVERQRSRPVVTRTCVTARSPVKGPSFTTAGCSTSEVARFASAELLHRAWFTLPLCDILRRVQVSMASTITLRTPKVVTITGSHRTTRRTSLAGLVCIDLLDTNTSTFGFVRERINRRTGIQHSLSSGRGVSYSHLTKCLVCPSQRLSTLRLPTG